MLGGSFPCLIMLVTVVVRRERYWFALPIGVKLDSVIEGEEVKLLLLSAIFSLYAVVSVYVCMYARIWLFGCQSLTRSFQIVHCVCIEAIS